MRQQLALQHGQQLVQQLADGMPFARAAQRLSQPLADDVSLANLCVAGPASPAHHLHAGTASWTLAQAPAPPPHLPSLHKQFQSQHGCHDAWVPPIYFVGAAQILGHMHYLYSLTERDASKICVSRDMLCWYGN